MAQQRSILYFTLLYWVKIVSQYFQLEWKSNIIFFHLFTPPIQIKEDLFKQKFSLLRFKYFSLFSLLCLLMNYYKAGIVWWRIFFFPEKKMKIVLSPNPKAIFLTASEQWFWTLFGLDWRMSPLVYFFLNHQKLFIHFILNSFVLFFGSFFRFLHFPG